MYDVYVCVQACIGMFLCVSVSVHTSARVWRSDPGLGSWSSPAVYSESESFSCLLSTLGYPTPQASALSYLYLLSCHRSTGLQMCTAVLSFCMGAGNRNLGPRKSTTGIFSTEQLPQPTNPFSKGARPRFQTLTLPFSIPEALCYF